MVGLHQAGETQTLVRGQDLSRAALREALADVELLVTFYGKRFYLVIEPRVQYMPLGGRSR